MGAFSMWHMVILAVVALVLFGGRGKISDLMGDFGKGISSFKKGLAEADKADAPLIDARSDAALNTEKSTA